MDRSMVTRAAAFVKELYGVDCTDAEVHAYCYQNKVAVQLTAAEDQIFDVRFYYEDTTPVGVLFFQSSALAKQVMDANQASCFF